MNSFAIGGDNQIFNLLDKDTLFEKDGKDLKAATKEGLLNALQNDEKRNVLNQGKKKKIICNCKKTQCLKKYCECYVNGELCSDECNCCDCCNNEAHLDILQKAREEAI